jgi:uncharacterized protein
MVVVSDTSPITNLLKIGQLNLLKDVFQKVIVPEKVHDELLEWKKLGADISEYENADWFEVVTPADYSLVRQLQIQLDSGESEAIALASELKSDYLLIDERRGWNIAKSMGINAIGIVGVLLHAKKTGLVNNVMPIIDDLRTKAGFWLTDSFYSQIKSIVKE